MSRIVAGLSTVAVGLYIFIPYPTDERVRLVGVAGVTIWYVLSNMAMRRALRQWQR
jgi:mannitol/fructose-specific phosphotransferase system IIA component